MKRLITLLIVLPLVIATLCSQIFLTPVYAASPIITITDKPACRTNATYLKGQVTGVTYANYRIAVYIYVNGWWNKPTFAAPLTAISSTGTWQTNVVTGGNDAMATKFAAFLVPKTYKPPLLSSASDFPAELYANSLANVQTDRACILREINFSGYTWQVKYSAGTTGPGPNYFSDSTSDVFVDSTGRLHLKIVPRGGKWYSTEIINKSVLGFGKYSFTVENPLTLDPRAVLGLFTWDDTSPDYSHREMDIQFSNWGEVKKQQGAQFVIQPYTNPANIYKFTFDPYSLYNKVGGTVGRAFTLPKTTNTIDWKSNSVYFTNHTIDQVRWSEVPPRTISWTYTGSSVPQEGQEQARINLWLYNGIPPMSGKAVEAIISNFTFVPNP